VPAEVNPQTDWSPTKVSIYVGTTVLVVSEGSDAPIAQILDPLCRAERILCAALVSNSPTPSPALHISVRTLASAFHNEGISRAGRNAADGARLLEGACRLASLPHNDSALLLSDSNKQPRLTANDRARFWLANACCLNDLGEHRVRRATLAFRQSVLKGLGRVPAELVFRRSDTH
jgi:hypothetical protein